MRATTISGLFVMLGMAVGCAVEAPVPDADDAPEQAAPAQAAAPTAEAEMDEVSLGSAFYGLTVIDCQTEATQCFEKSLKSGDKRPFSCTAQLSGCLADVGLQATGDVAHDAVETVACGTEGLGCLKDAEKLADAVSCHREVEDCVADKVEDVTGIRLPPVEKVVETAVDVVQDTAEVAGEVVKGTVDLTAHITGKVIEKTVDAAGHVVIKTLDATGKVIKTTLDATGKVLEQTVEAVGQVANVAGEVVKGTIGAAVNVTSGVTEVATGLIGGVASGVGGLFSGIGKLADCSSKSQKCWRETRDYKSCQDAYRTCLKTK